MADFRNIVFVLWLITLISLMQMPIPGESFHIIATKAGYMFPVCWPLIILFSVSVKQIEHSRLEIPAQWRSHGGRGGARAPPTPSGTTHEILANPKTFLVGE